MELSKLWFFNSYIFATQFLYTQRFAPSGCKEIDLKIAFVYRNALTLKCHFYEMSYLWNVLYPKYPIYEMSCLWNVLSMKCPVYEMSCLWNASVYEMSCLWNVLSMKCPVLKIYQHIFACCTLGWDWGMY